LANDILFLTSLSGCSLSLYDIDVWCYDCLASDGTAEPGHFAKANHFWTAVLCLVTLWKDVQNFSTTSLFYSWRWQRLLIFQGNVHSEFIDYDITFFSFQMQFGI
jgi:hypothetical protein